MSALIETAPLPAHPGCTAFKITGLSYSDVQTAIFNLADRYSVAEFRYPIKEDDGRWRATGYVRGDGC